MANTWCLLKAHERYSVSQLWPQIHIVRASMALSRVYGSCGCRSVRDCIIVEARCGWGELPHITVPVVEGRPMVLIVPRCGRGPRVQRGRGHSRGRKQRGSCSRVPGRLFHESLPWISGQTHIVSHRSCNSTQSRVIDSWLKRNLNYCNFSDLVTWSIVLCLNIFCYLQLRQYFNQPTTIFLCC